MRQKLITFHEDELFKRIESKATENRRPVNTEIIIAIENHLKDDKKV